MASPVPPEAPSSLPGPKLSNAALLGIAVIGGVVLVAIFAYILLIAAADLDTRLWWMGLASMIFALAFYLIYAATSDRRISRPLAGAFFLIGAGSFYASIFLNQDPESTKLLWLIVLSILVVVVLIAIFVMARGAEADAVRRAKRRVTP